MDLKRSARLLLTTKAIRGYGDGFTALLLPVYLTSLGLSAFQVGLVATAAMLGSAVLTLGVGLAGHRVSARGLLMVSCLLMLATGLGFSQAHSFWPLVIVAFGENSGGYGGTVAAPMVKALMTTWFRGVNVPSSVKGKP